jgi:hypothetical protein
MSLSAAELVLEIATAHILPTLAVELGRVALARTPRATHDASHATADRPHHRRRMAAKQHLRLVEPPVVTAPRVLSSTPGRTRIQIDGLRGSPERARQLNELFCSTDGVRQATISHLTGTALVEFDEERVSLDELVELATPRPAGSSAAHRGGSRSLSFRIVDGEDRPRVRRAFAPPRVRVPAAQLPLAGL